jgi:hypothetical protein
MALEKPLDRLLSRTILFFVKSIAVIFLTQNAV